MFFNPFPAKKHAPPLDTWMMIGDFNSLAASITALAVEEVVTLTAGIANPFLRAVYSKEMRRDSEASHRNSIARRLKLTSPAGEAARQFRHITIDITTIAYLEDGDNLVSSDDTGSDGFK